MSRYVVLKLTERQAIALSVLLENVTNFADSTPSMRVILRVEKKLNAAAGFTTWREAREKEYRGE